MFRVKPRFKFLRHSVDGPLVLPSTHSQLGSTEGRPAPVCKVLYNRQRTHAHPLCLSDRFFFYAIPVWSVPVVGSAVASWLVRSSTDRAVRVQALLFSWARHFTLTVPLSTRDYKWVPVICWGKPNKLLGGDLRWTSIPSRGSRNTPSRFMATETGISSGPMNQLALRLHFSFVGRYLPGVI